MIDITEEDLQFVGANPKPFRDNMIRSIDPFSEINAERFSLSAHFVGMTCGDFNLDVMCNAAGKKGSGKSYSTIELARCCAVRTAEKLDNNPDGWKDYFDVERNMAIMDVDKMIDIMTSNEKHQVIISDDSGTIQGARRFRSDDNQLLNNVFVVNRTLNNIYFSSAPESKHVDRQARDLPEHQLDFVRNLAGLSRGFATCKYFQKITDPKTSVSYHQYHYWRNEKVLRCVIQKPPKELIEEYERLRDKGRIRIQNQLKEMKEGREKADRDAPELETAPQKKTREQIAAERMKKIAAAQDYVNECMQAGMSKKETLAGIEKNTGVNLYSWREWVSVGKAHW